MDVCHRTPSGSTVLLAVQFAGSIGTVKLSKSKVPVLMVPHGGQYGNVGDAVGVAVGVLVGVIVGVSIGVCVGVAVGEPDGTK